MKKVWMFIGILLGFALSYIPNNYMDEKYEDFAFYLVIVLTINGIIWGINSNNKKKSEQ